MLPFLLIHFGQLPGTCVFISGTGVGTATNLLPGTVWTERECAHAVIATHKGANGVVHQAYSGMCSAVVQMTTIVADPAARQRSCFLYTSRVNTVCTVAPAACDSHPTPNGSPFVGHVLSLPTRAVYGSIPTQLGVLSQLQHLDLASNSLSGTLPSELGMLTRLEALHLAHNRLSGSVPSELGKLTALDSLQVFDNSLGGALPSQLGLLHPTFCYLLQRQWLLATEGSGVDGAGESGTFDEGNTFECPLPTLYPGCGQHGLAFDGRVAQGGDLCGGRSGLVSYTAALL